MATPHQPLRVTRRYLENLYDALYKEGQRLFDKFNPCNIEPSGKFKRRSTGYYPDRRESATKWELMNCSRYNDGPGFCCCNGCKHLGKKGCRVKSLGCKLWLCYVMDRPYPELLQALGRLCDIASAHQLAVCRGSKRHSLGRAFRVLKGYKKGTYSKHGVWLHV